MVFTRVARYSIIGNYYREFYYLFRSTWKIEKKTVKLNMCASCNRCFFKRMILYFLHKIYDRLLLENSHCLCWRLKAGSNCPQFQGGFFTGEHRILPPGKRWTLMWPLRMNIPKDISCRGKYQTSISQSKGCSWSGHIGCQWKMALGTCQPKAHLVDCSAHRRTSDSRKKQGETEALQWLCSIL